MPRTSSLTTRSGRGQSASDHSVHLNVSHSSVDAAGKSAPSLHGRVRTPRPDGLDPLNGAPPAHARPETTIPPVLLSRELSEAARQAVEAALSAEFPADDLLGAGVSRTVSVLTSTVKRSGHIIEKAIAEALEHAGLIVYRNVAMPVTVAAQSLVASNSVEILDRIRVAADAQASRTVFIDLLVVDPERGHAAIYELKRGGGATETRKRLPIEASLRACRLQLRSFVRGLGHHVEETDARIIDYYGASGFSPDLTITRRELDAHFGVPVRATVDTSIAVMRRTLEQALPQLIGAMRIGAPAGARPEVGRQKVAPDLSASQAGPFRRVTRLPQGLVLDPAHLGALDLDDLPLAEAAVARRTRRRSINRSSNGRGDHAHA